MESWITNFAELMFGAEHNRSTMDEAAKLKYKYMPARFYKYRQITDNTIEAFEKDLAFFSVPTQFNDLREAPICLATELSQHIITQEYATLRAMHPELPFVEPTDAQTFLSAISDHYARVSQSPDYLDSDHPLMKMMIQLLQGSLHKYLNDIQRNARSSYGVFCLTTSYDNEAMWAHYANNHSGFCIEYDIKSLGLLNDTVQLTFPVIYNETNTAKPIVLRDIEELNGSYTMNAILQKGKQWNYENEWRILSLPNYDDHKIINSPRAVPFPYVTAVYFGQAIKKMHRERLLEICKNKKIHAYDTSVEITCDKMIRKQIL